MAPGPGRPGSLARETPEYLRQAAGLSARQAELVDLDELVHDVSGGGFITRREEAQLDGELRVAMREIREARTRWEASRVDAKFR